MSIAEVNVTDGNIFQDEDSNISRILRLDIETQKGSNSYQLEN